MEGKDKQSELFIHPVDSDGCCALYLSAPPENIVLLQGILESYEGLGVLRTLHDDPLLLGFYTTDSALTEAMALLESLALPYSLRFHSKETISRFGILNKDFDTLLREGLQC
jgi:hypothetical protein